MPDKYQPDYVYLRHVKTFRVHIFTGIQIVCSVIMWFIKSIQATSIIFPLMVRHAKLWNTQKALAGYTYSGTFRVSFTSTYTRLIEL